MERDGAAVTFDLWHTLVYLEPDAEEAYMAAQVELAADLLERAPPIREGAERDRSEIARIFEEEYAAAVTASLRGESVTPEAQFRRAAQRVGRAAPPGEYVEGLRRLVALTPFRCGPHATEVVRSLREGGLRTAVISNTIGEPGSALRPLLHTMGFDPWVEAYVFSDEHPWTKPNPAIFGEALERLEVPAERAVHVGDGWVDVEGARRAGLRAAVLFTGLQQYGHRYHSLFLPAGSTAPASDYRIDRLDELPDLAERLLGAGKSG